MDGRQVAAEIDGQGDVAAAGTDIDADPTVEAAFGDDTELDQPVPDAERMILETVALCGADKSIAALVRRYWRYAPDEELVDFTPAEMLTAVRRHLELAQQRVPGELKLRIAPASNDRHSAIEIVTDDMPFLVDSVMAALAGREMDIYVLIHPLLVVRREPLGKLIEVCADAEPDSAGGDKFVESWIRLEIDRTTDELAIGDLQRDLQRVLTDVREAVEDWPKMRLRALGLADELAEATLPVPDRDISDSIELLQWLANDHFTFLGYREYKLKGNELRAVSGTGLGILRQDQQGPRLLSELSPEAYHHALEKRLLIITKANSRSTVHRSAYLDYIGFKTFDADGNVTGEKRFLGLFASAAYQRSVRDLPVVKRKVESVLERSGLSPRSHSGKDLIAILEDYPRDELFQIKTDELYESAMGVLRLAGRRQLRLFLRKDGYGRFISCQVYLPRDRGTTANRLKIQEILLRELNGVGVDYTTRVSESPLARYHFIVRTDPSNPPHDADAEAIQAKLAAATVSWDDDFRLLLERKLGEESAKTMFARYNYALPEQYKDAHTPYEAAKDLQKLELLDRDGQLALHMFRRRKDDSDVRFKVYRAGEPMLLSAVLPVLHSLGVKVSDERPYEVTRADRNIYIYDFGLLMPPESRDLAEVRMHLENGFRAIWRGDAEIDGLNELIAKAGLTWRQVVLLRLYAKYLRQAGTVFSQESVESTFVAYPDFAALLVALFETRFSPNLAQHGTNRETQAKELVAAISRRLDDVASLDQDRILRSYLTLIQATLRTSFFQRPQKSYVSVKLDPQAIPDLPAPRPKYEIFVYSPRFEGVHLRFGAVARGGLRWSDRRDDFRTEILGLVKAQMVKNAVIVPVGAKGGFVLKQAPSPADRDAFQAEGVACYKQFICALLDITDNIVSGAIMPPADVVRHDGDDPYLVVAADKGTATFSDTANAISKAYGFWMGDAFASGGSAGYDHKGMGITARGAWESVKRHFRDMGVDTQTEDFTVVGIGDMSGDVFGNGVLLSRHIRLVAAFDHRHIFLDPNPDATRSYAERQRLFALPRSSWDDYDRSLISAGGGVYPRSAKSIPITPEVRATLGLADDDLVSKLSPAELMRAILQAPVDLLWNGGIGTYVKASTESHVEVGDKANDSIRVNGKQLRAKVVGEGGNLGLTQRGRVEYAMFGGPPGAQPAGGRITTDFIDNSAGVDCSDHEVNIKILLGGAVADGEMTFAERDALLAQMTDEVADLVLRDNYDQATALGNARAQASSLLPVHRRLLTDLEKAGRLDRAIEAMPIDEELVVRAEAGNGLTSPEFAVLLAYVKIALEDEITASDLPDDPWCAEVLADYFPTPLRDEFADRMGEHRLRREIITTSLVNEVVNRGGTTFVYRAIDETGASAADVIRAFVIVREIYGLRQLWAQIEALDNRVPTAVQTGMYLEARRLIDRATRWLVTTRRSPLDVPSEIARLRPGVAKSLSDLPNLTLGEEHQTIQDHIEESMAHGIPAETAELETRIMYGFGLLDVVSLADSTGQDVTDVAPVYFVLSERFRVDELLTRISHLPRQDRWQTLARMALRYDLYAALAALTAEVLSTTEPGLSAVERVADWEQKNATSIARARNAIGEADDAGRVDLAALSVLLRQIRTLVRPGAG
jgi:glutamate dehydrogenase